MQTISAVQLKRMIDSEENFELINVLPESEFRKEHIPNSVNVPVQDESFIKRVEERVHGDKGRKIVVYCANVECEASPIAAKALRRAGFSNVVDFEAGMAAWKEASLPVESGQARV